MGQSFSSHGQLLACRHGVGKIRFDQARVGFIYNPKPIILLLEDIKFAKE